jgi:hypothetical protein
MFVVPFVSQPQAWFCRLPDLAARRLRLIVPSITHDIDVLGARVVVVEGSRLSIVGSGAGSE